VTKPDAAGNQIAGTPLIEAPDSKEEEKKQVEKVKVLPIPIVKTN
jgi:hypothetical protein